jgi:hypothetical protein
MSLLKSSGGENYVGVRNVAVASSWYLEKLGLRKVKVEMDEGEGCLVLGFSHDEGALTLGPADKPTSGLTPMLFAPSAQKAREFLTSRGVTVGEIQQDRQHTRFFEMRDLEDNVIEICEEP